MSSNGLSSADPFLAEAARRYFMSTYQHLTITQSAVVDKNLDWVPSLHFKINDHLTIIVETSEGPYPVIFNMRRQNIERLQMPISIYCICPEEAYLKFQADAKRLINDGYGLLTVAADGSVQKRSSCIPVIQQITKEEFASDISKLNPTMKRRLAESFERYNQNAPSGSADIAEVMEGMILKAGRDSVTKGWLQSKDAKPGAPAKTLDAMNLAPQFQNAAAAIGAARAFISMYRNTSHHFPKDKKQAAIKYRDCRHAFLEGLKKIILFRESMKSLGLSGGL